MTGLRGKLFLAGLAFCWAAVFSAPGPVLGLGPSQGSDLDDLLDRVAERAKSRPEVKSWKAGTVTVATEMDKNWRPKKTTRVTKAVAVTEFERSEKVLEALQTEKGVTKDITAEYNREAEEERGAAKDKPGEKGSGGGGEKEEERGMGRSLSLEEFLPFAKKDRENFIFARLPDDRLEGRTVWVLESKAKIRDEKFWEGQYFIDPENYEVLKVRLTLSKNPRFVKEISTEIDFQVLPDGHFFIKRTRMKVDAGMVIKHIRMVVEEEYSDIEIL